MKKPKQTDHLGGALVIAIVSVLGLSWLMHVILETQPPTVVVPISAPPPAPPSVGEGPSPGQPQPVVPDEAPQPDVWAPQPVIVAPQPAVEGPLTNPQPVSGPDPTRYPCCTPCKKPVPPATAPYRPSGW